MSSCRWLPLELHFFFLEWWELCLVCRVSRAWHKASFAPSIWKSVHSRYLPATVPVSREACLLHLVPGRNWRACRRHSEELAPFQPHVFRVAERLHAQGMVASPSG